MRIFRLLLQSEIRAHDDVAQLGGFTQEPFEIGVQLGATARNVHYLEGAGLKRRKAFLERLARHGLGVLGSALEIAMAASQVAGVGYVHLHRSLMLVRL